MNKIFIISVFIFLFTNCKKENESGVYIRLQNNTTTLFSNISIANSKYGIVSPATISNYKLITQPVFVAGCTATITDSSFYIGYMICGTPMPSAFKKGKYTFIIKPSTSTFGYYNIEMKKD